MIYKAPYSSAFRIEALLVKPPPQSGGFTR